MLVNHHCADSTTIKTSNTLPYEAMRCDVVGQRRVLAYKDSCLMAERSSERVENAFIVHFGNINIRSQVLQMLLN